MLLLILGLVIFLGVHSTDIFTSNWRRATIERIGIGAWKGIYSVLSIIGFVLLIYGYGIARQDPIVLWNPPAWTRHLAALLMLPVFILFIAAYLPGRIKATLKHPMLNAVKFWAIAHLVANGTAADVILFGSFLAWAVADRIAIKRRPPRPIPSAPPGKYNDAIAVIGGLAVYALFVLYLHVRWIGVYPLPELNAALS